MKRRTIVFLAVSAIALSMTGAKANNGPPIPELGVFSPEAGTVLPGGDCTAGSFLESDFDFSQVYGSKCQRLRIVFGPIWSKPGQNDVLIQPVTFEKPYYPGYLVRFEPDVIGATGESPRVKDVHLHHGTWINANRSYGWGPWIASGEEQTIAKWPVGYGVNIQPTDQWLFLHMIHNATAETFPLWVVYSLDFIPAADAEADTDVDTPGVQPLITNTRGIWLDVGDCSWHSACQKDRFNPIFNIQRGRGAVADGMCVFPRENCAHQNTMAGISAQQGMDLGPLYDEWRIPIDGTLVLMGGHLHFGGLRDDVYLVRPQPGPDGIKGTSDDIVDEETDVKLIHKSDAYYFDHNYNSNAWTPADDFDPAKSLVGDKPTSWDMVMTGTSRDFGWSINVEAGDRLRLEGVYDSTIASWYEQMGIVMSWIVPNQHIGVDPFAPGVSIEEGLNSQAVNMQTAPGVDLPGENLPTCNPNATTICVRGQATHARVPTSADHGSCPLEGCQDIAMSAQDGPMVTDIAIGAFGYGAAGLGVIDALGIPRVKVGTPVTFWNLDTAAYMWHTITRCKNPCSGTTSASYPIPNGAWDDIRDGNGQPLSASETLALGPDPMDFDSGQLGIGVGATNNISWDFTPERTGTYTFFCRIHPSMRGAIRVVE